MHPFIFLATYWNPGIAKIWPIVKKFGTKSGEFSQ
jgi:hypothetical protein